MSAVSAANFLMDLLFMRLYFCRRDNGGIPIWRRLLGLFCILLTVILYPTGRLPFFSKMLSRFFVRLLLTTAGITIAFPIKFVSSVYSSLYWCTAHLLIQSLFFSPDTYALFVGTFRFVESYAVSLALCIASTFLIKAVCFLPFVCFTPLEHVSPVRQADIIPVVLIDAVALYSRELAIPLTQSDTTFTELSSYFLILQVVLMVLLCYIEYSRRDRRESAMMELKKQEAEALLQGIENRNLNAQAISALRHDIKNHLLGIRLLLSEGRLDEADRYISDLLERTVPPRRTYNTGNELLNGLLSVKLDDTKCRDISSTVNLDLRAGTFFSNFDLCVLFGNVIDNALEACSDLPQGREPYIKISGGQRANMLLVRVENPCRRRVLLVNGLPSSAKTNAQIHGFGLKNVKGVLEKYGGSMTISQESDDTFVLTMLIPIPQDSAVGKE